MAPKPDAGFSIADLMDEEIDQITGSSSTDTPDPEPSTPEPETPSTELAGDEPGDKSTETPAPDEAAAGEERDAGAGTEPAAAAEAPQPDAAAAPAAIPGAKPFQFKASGGTHVFPGAQELPDGSVVIAKDSQAEFRRVLASERELRQNFQKTVSQHRRELDEAKKVRTAKDVEADAVFKLFGDLKKMTPEERFDFFQDFDQRAPQLELEIQREQLKQEREALERQKAGPEPTPEERQEQLQTVLVGELNATFQRLAALPELKQLTRDDLAGVYQKWQGKTDRLLRQLTADDPATGMKKGEWVFDDSDIVDDIKFLLKVKEGASRSSGAAAANAARNGDTNAAPPVVAGGRIPAAPAKPKQGARFDRDKFMQDGEG
jgi:hypothetical protein